MNDRAKLIIKVISVFIFIAVVSVLGYVSLRFAMDKEGFKAWMDAHGVFGSVTYIFMVILQIIVAIIPGGPIEMAGGYAFGAIRGIVYFTIGAFVGSLIVFLLVKRFGHHFVEIYFKSHEIKRLKFLNDDRKRDTIFMILFLLPGSPKDLLCYVAGLTRMKLPVFIIISSLCRLPAVIGSSISGAAYEDNSYFVAILAFAITLFVSLFGILIYYRIVKNNQKDE